MNVRRELAINPRFARVGAVTLLVALLAAVWLVAGAVATRPARASGPPDDPQQSAIAQIHQLQADFHRAKTFRDIDLMMSLWAADATFKQGTVTLVGTDELRAFWLSTGSFNTKLNMRESLTPSFKIRIQPHGDMAFLYFECHDVDEVTGTFVSHLWLAGTVKHVDGHWVFWHMNGGAISDGWAPNTYYFQL